MSVETCLYCHQSEHRRDCPMHDRNIEWVRRRARDYQMDWPELSEVEAMDDAAGDFIHARELRRQHRAEQLRAAWRGLDRTIERLSQ